MSVLGDLLINKTYAAGTLSDTLSEKMSSINGGFTSKEDFVQKIVDLAVPLSIACAVILLGYGGYLLISSQGSPDKLQEARSVITNAIIGLLVVLLCVAILLLISRSLQLNIYE